MKRLLFLVIAVTKFGVTVVSAQATNIYPASGAVGIGTTQPDQKLTISAGNLKVVNPGPYPYGIVIDQDFTGNWTREFGLSYKGKGKLAAFGSYAVDSNLIYAYIGGNTSNHSPYGQPWMVFDSSNNVGVGFTVPKDLLHARRDRLGTTSIHVQNNDNDFSSRAGIAMSTQNGTWRLTAVRGEGFALSAPLLPDIFWVTNQGSFGMGTKTPGSYKLAVEGTIGARKVRVTQAAWADFVFDPGYRLMPLHELEAYIRQYRHLPEIPTEAEVVADGLDLGEINKNCSRKWRSNRFTSSK